jgi:hypothetical protein
VCGVVVAAERGGDKKKIKKKIAAGRGFSSQYL